jgi:hypothetical protein
MHAESHKRFLDNTQILISLSLSLSNKSSTQKTLINRIQWMAALASELLTENGIVPSD